MIEFLSTISVFNTILVVLVSSFSIFPNNIVDAILPISKTGCLMHVMGVKLFHFPSNHRIP